jgi:thymidine kinase
MMYSDPQRYAFAFQSYVQLTMLENHMEMNEKAYEEKSEQYTIKIMERTLYSAKYCFIENIYQR